MRFHLSGRASTAVVAGAAATPVIVCAAMVPFRARIENTNTALVLILVVVAAAASGVRRAGIIAALSGTVCWAFFLTQPYQQIVITDEADMVTAALLTLVGVAVAEILWARRRQTRAHQQQIYLTGLLRTAGIVAAGSSHTEGVIVHVADQLVDLLGVDDCYFDSDTVDQAPAALVRDGTVVRRGRDLDVERLGLPTDCEIELRVHHNGITRGRFLLVASTRLSRPSLAQRQVAIALADQVGAALATHDRSW
jgi:K+-sensing histidine kinase KdpD